MFLSLNDCISTYRCFFSLHAVSCLGFGVYQYFTRQKALIWHISSGNWWQLHFEKLRYVCIGVQFLSCMFPIWPSIGRSFFLLFALTISTVCKERNYWDVNYRVTQKNGNFWKTHQKLKKKKYILTEIEPLQLEVQGDTKKRELEKPNKNWRSPRKKIYWQKLNHYNLPFKRQ